MRMTKVRLDPQQAGIITCVACERKKAINAREDEQRIRSQDGKRFVKVHCLCGNEFYVGLEYRQSKRRAVNLHGKIFQGPLQETRDIIVKSLSVIGIGFIVNEDFPIHIGDMFHISFYLDDEKHTPVHDEIAIRRIQGDFVGATFLQQDHYNFTLDFYLT